MPGIDYKKEYPDLYLPKPVPALVTVPKMGFLMADGQGDPNGPDYQQAVSLLYALTFTIKMSKKSGQAPEGYFEYVVPPLEGLWWCEGGKEAFDFNLRENWRWTSMIRQPEFVTPETFQWALEQCRRKKPELPVERARLEWFEEGLCAQMLHVGPYVQEPASIEVMKAFLDASGCSDETGIRRKHHEIYLSDPRRCAPDKIKTVLRHPCGPAAR